FGDPNGAAVLLGLGLSLNRLSLSLLKDYKDAPGDAKAHKRTFLLRYGGTLTARLSLGLAVVGMGMVLVVLASQTLSTQYLVLVVTAGWLLYERSKLFRHQDYVGLNRVFHDCLYYQLIFDTMVVLWLSI
ncbi:UbiA family prenyltransferase, partial [Candidatus Saccharibacteria bacterium]|nr:UbiA family prenyltransferase [Candidatus Saccharibacteria bacterium]